jgi:AcrR family transcriptional regulator
LSRVEQTERNRSLVLDAARDVFMARGYHAATLEQIAESAGFSRGVVYSQFESKADLFLSLLEARI